MAALAKCRGVGAAAASASPPPADDAARAGRRSSVAPAESGQKEGGGKALRRMRSNSLWKTARGVAPRHVATQGPGVIVGEIALFKEEGRRTATVRIACATLAIAA